MPTSDLDAFTSHEKAGVLLAARRATVSRGLSWPSVDEILAATGADPTLAHEVEEAVLALLPTLEPDPAAAVTHKALRFVFRHPGCVQLSESGVRYTARYRRFVIALRKQYADVSTARFAEAIRLPLDTLEDLLAGTRGARRAEHRRRTSGLEPDVDRTFALLVLDRSPDLEPGAIAGLLLAARSAGAKLGRPWETVEQIVEATSVSRSRAYELKDAIFASLVTLVRPPGRPRAEPQRPSRHPDSARSPTRRSASSCSIRDACRAAREPATRSITGNSCSSSATGTLTWRSRSSRQRSSCRLVRSRTGMRCGRPAGDPRVATKPDESPAPDEPRATDEPHAVERDAKQAQIETVLAAWRSWHGDFGAFCVHVRRDHRLELGNTLIANILFAHGERDVVRRGGHRRDDEALRGSFKTFIAGAQWGR